LFGGVDLDLVLKARDRSVLMDNQGGRHECTVNKAFRSENDGEVCLRGCLGDDGPGAFEELRIGRRHGFAHSIAGDEAFRKADDPYSLDGGLIDGLHGERDRLLRSGRGPDIGECDWKLVHEISFWNSATQILPSLYQRTTTTPTPTSPAQIR